MSTVKNGQISLYFHFNKIIEGPETSFQSLSLCKNMLEMFVICLTKFHFGKLGFKRNKHKCNFHYVAIPMMT